MPIVDRSYVARDNERIYSYGVVVRGADPTQFCALGRGYWTDDRGVWVDDGKVPVVGADAASFLVPGPNDPRIDRDDAGDGTDRNRPYRCGRPVPLAAAFDHWPLSSWHARTQPRGGGTACATRTDKRVTDMTRAPCFTQASPS